LKLFCNTPHHLLSEHKTDIRKKNLNLLEYSQKNPLNKSASELSHSKPANGTVVRL